MFFKWLIFFAFSVSPEGMRNLLFKILKLLMIFFLNVNFCVASVSTEAIYSYINIAYSFHVSQCGILSD